MLGARGVTRASGKCGKGLNAGGYGYESRIETVTAYFRMWVSCFWGSGKEASVTSETGNLSHSLKARERRYISVTSLLTRFTHTWIKRGSHIPGFDRQATITVVEAIILIHAMFREDRYLGGVPWGWSQWHIWSVQCLTTSSQSMRYSPSPPSCFLLYTPPCSALLPRYTLHCSFLLGLLYNVNMEQTGSAWISVDFYQLLRHVVSRKTLYIHTYSSDSIKSRICKIITVERKRVKKTVNFPVSQITQREDLRV